MSISITNQQNLLSQASGIDQSTTSTGATKKSTQLGQADFLKLLTVQLQNQDPMSPMSDMDFIASMSSFSSVDAITSLSSNFETFMTNQSVLNASTLEALQSLSASTAENQILQSRANAQFYLGKEVTINDPIKGEFSGIVDRIELVEKLNMDGIKENMVAVVVNDEIFPVQLITAYRQPETIAQSLGNLVSSIL